MSDPTEDVPVAENPSFVVEVAEPAPEESSEDLATKNISLSDLLAEQEASLEEFAEVDPDYIPERKVETPEVIQPAEPEHNGANESDVPMFPYTVETAEEVIGNMRSAVGIPPLPGEHIGDQKKMGELGTHVPASENAAPSLTSDVPNFETAEVPSVRFLDAAETRAIDDDEVYDDDDNAIMDSDDPLLRRVQEALRKQLSATKNKLAFEIKEKEQAVHTARKHREEVGVELYSVQQQLARLQAALEGANDAHGVVQGYREDAEKTFKDAAEQYKSQKAKLQHHLKNLEQHKDELDKVSKTLKQVDLYNDELRSKIAVTKRTTLKAEEDLVKQEIEKKRQDYFVDQLQAQLHKLQDRRAQYEAQLVAQQRETKAAYETLQEAGTEMEAIMFEKRQLLHQWKSSVIGMQRREEVIQSIDVEIEKEKSTVMSMSGEINGFKHSLRKALEQNETLTTLLNKLDSEVDMLKRQIQGVSDARDKLKESYAMYEKSLTQTEQELGSVMQERQALVIEVSALQKQATAQIRETNRLEQEISDRLQAQVAIEKGTQGAKKDSTKLRQQIHEKEAEVAKIQNELANIRLESLGTFTRIESVKSRAKEIDKDLQIKNNLIERYEVEIRRRNEELGKKQAEMDLLNKKYDQLTGNSQDESVGPLEATIHNMTKLVQAKEKENTELQQFWLRAQTDLVNMAKKGGEITESIQDLRMRLTVLSHKKVVVNGQFEREEKDIKEHHKNIRKLQIDMQRVNMLLSKHATVQSLLEENNLGLENEFRNKLKDAELESLRMEDQVVALKAEKERALDGLIEAERQMMLWEKKIQLARETQSALDPNVGATEIREMGMEIHRMKLRHAALLKLQEKMISEMEKSVTRRESIATKAKTKGKVMNQATVQKGILDASKRLKQTVADVRECDRDIGSLVESQETAGKHLDEATSSCQQLEARKEYLGIELERKESQRCKNMAEISLFQKRASRLSDLRAGRYVPMVKEENARPQEAERQKDRLQKIEEIVKYLESDYPPLKAALEPVKAYLSASGPIKIP